jgi:hypothetical protein
MVLGEFPRRAPPSGALFHRSLPIQMLSDVALRYYSRTTDPGAYGTLWDTACQRGSPRVLQRSSVRNNQMRNDKSFTEVTTRVSGTAGNVLARLFTIGGSVDCCFDIVGFGRVHHWTQATWPEHAVGDTMALHCAGSDTTFC